MFLPTFRLEEYLGEREFSTEIVFSGSDMESYGMQELLAMADSESLTLWNTLTLKYTEPRGHPLILQELGKLLGFKNPSKQICTFADA